ncbi:MAG: hypothetical protein V3T72_12335 [Thermoanaerobaculia bacterium]
MYRHLSASSAWLSSFTLLAILATASAPAFGEPLTLRVNDTMGRPDELIAVVIRTYAPRTIGQGQICLRTVGNAGVRADPSKGTAAPLLIDLESFVVFSDEGDVVSEGSFDDLTQTALISFESLSATINQSDGPLAVLFFRLAASAPPGTQVEIVIDPGDTFLLGPEGEPIPIEPRAGELEVLSPGAPFVLAADGDEAPPGGVARLGVTTSEIFPIATGWAALRYDPLIAGGPPTVTMDPRYGEASFAVDDSLPGLVVIAFSSPDASLNSIPGDLITIDLPLSSHYPVGTLSPIRLDPDLTFLTAPGGSEIPLLLEEDVIELIPGSAIFLDGFETGGVARWSAATP